MLVASVAMTVAGLAGAMTAGHLVSAATDDDWAGPGFVAAGDVVSIDNWATEGSSVPAGGTTSYDLPKVDYGQCGG